MLTEDLRERINKLSLVKRQLLNQQLRRQRAVSTSFSPILSGTAAATAPLSFTQQQVWRTQSAYPTATFYNFPQVLQLEGTLNMAALANALRYLAARHDVLRTRFALAGDTPCAVIGTPPAAVDLRFVPDDPPFSAFEAASALHHTLTVDDLLYRQVARPFDLTADLPLSAQLLRIAPDQHFLSLVHHFVAFDYWSLNLFNRELGHCYNAYAGGITPTLPPLPYTYADYAVWQHSPENLDHLATMSHYWRWQLAKRTPAGAALADRPYQPVTTFAADSFEFCLPAPMLRRLERLAQHENATLFMLLLGSLQVLLGRYTGRHQIATGALVANRPVLESELLLGNFSNRLLLWGNLAGNPTFRQLLHRVRSATLDAYARQEMPLESVARDLNPECCGIDAGDLFPVMFDYVNEPLVSPNLHGLTVTRLPMQSGESEYPLHVTAQRSENHLRVRLQVRPDFAVRTAVSHMAYHWNTMLSAIAEDPEQQIESLPLTRNQPRPYGASSWLARPGTLSSSPAVRL
ncbi:MAG: condensation domain-containing protein [Caldilineaceae bacterium]